MAATALTIGLGGLGTVGLASAATNSNSSTGTSIVDKIAAKFGLNKTEVQAVFDTEHAEREAEHLTSLQDTLKTAVADGKLTQAQSDAIIAKYKDMQAKREANHDTMESLTEDERKTKMEKERTAFETWKTDNDIPDEYARLIRMGGRGHGGLGGPGGNMTPPSSSSSSAN